MADDGMAGEGVAHVAGRRREGAGLDAGGHEHLEESDRVEASTSEGDWCARRVSAWWRENHDNRATQMFRVEQDDLLGFAGPCSFEVKNSSACPLWPIPARETGGSALGKFPSSARARPSSSVSPQLQVPQALGGPSSALHLAPDSTSSKLPASCFQLSAVYHEANHGFTFDSAEAAQTRTAGQTRLSRLSQRPTRPIPRLRLKGSHWPSAELGPLLDGTWENHSTTNCGQWPPCSLEAPPEMT